MDARFGFVSARTAIADRNTRAASRTRTLPPSIAPFRTTPQRGHGEADEPLEIRATGTFQRRTPRAHTRFASHRSGHVRPANRLTIGFPALHLVGLRRRKEGSS